MLLCGTLRGRADTEIMVQKGADTRRNGVQVDVPHASCMLCYLRDHKLRKHCSVSSFGEVLIFERKSRNGRYSGKSCGRGESPQVGLWNSRAAGVLATVAQKASTRVVLADDHLF